MNITLSAPPETIRVVREWAAKEHTSLNQYIRDCLEAKAEELKAAREKKSAEFRAFLESLHVNMPEGWKFDREEANSRR